MYIESEVLMEMHKQGIIKTKPMSKSQAVRLLNQNAIKVNGQVVDKNYTVKKGDVVQVGKTKFIKAI